MAVVTTPTGQQFEETSPVALEYYQREPGYTVGEPVPAAAVDLADGTVDEVLAEVGDDVDKAVAALAAEQAKPKPRSSLVEKLQAVAARPADPVE